MSRRIDLTSELEDPFGSEFIKRLDDLETEELSLDKKMRLDLIDPIQDKLEYIMMINRIMNTVFVENSIEIIGSDSDLVKLQTSTAMR